VRAAADWGTYVCAHVYTPEGIQRALRAGVKSIKHDQLAELETVRIMREEGAWWSIQPFLQDADSKPEADLSFLDDPTNNLRLVMKAGRVFKETLAQWAKETVETCRPGLCTGAMVAGAGTPRAAKRRIGRRSLSDAHPLARGHE
jgi:hypothetical protein